ncbi:hypothetical protein VFPPC_15683 [Pochonia chlamydosporia 170]|uniref:Uncharacterized protein n=1 Tax=Pochonia chlamydosporia 170 TaxID=1380566 RepID=A0A179G0D6_METCM|nr:hypothetical protein VFPPC_15683 [Pochonia chlamydosporia 170]OAQ71312.1 hypothetical protein VFPPC_15683 [Pochonia chlamydosporia 170]
MPVVQAHNFAFGIPVAVYPNQGISAGQRLKLRCITMSELSFQFLINQRGLPKKLQSSKLSFATTSHIGTPSRRNK